MHSIGFILGGTLLAAVGLQTSGAAAAVNAAKVDFAKEIQPILEKSCVECHGPQKAKSSLRVDLKADALKGGDTGALLVAGDASKSLLIQVVEGTHAEISRMPKKRDPLTPEQIALLRKWIEQGADWPDAAATEDARLKHWAFKAPTRPELPAAKNQRWVRNPVDAFILAKLDGEKLTPSPEADRTSLLRRLSLDLIGLPPTPQEVEAFLASHPRLDLDVRRKVLQSLDALRRAVKVRSRTWPAATAPGSAASPAREPAAGA